MSDLSVAYHKLEALVSGILGHVPPDTQNQINQALSDAKTQVTHAVVIGAQTVEPVMTDLEKAVEVAIDSALHTLLGPAGDIAAAVANPIYEKLALRINQKVAAKLAPKTA